MGQVTQWTAKMDEDLISMFYDGVVHGEISKALGVSVSSVRRRLYRHKLYVKGSTKCESHIREPWKPGTPKPDFTLEDPYESSIAHA
jgi:hypothetical protein